MVAVNAGSWVRLGSRAASRKAIPLYKPGELIVAFGDRHRGVARRARHPRHGRPARTQERLRQPLPRHPRRRDRCRGAVAALRAMQRSGVRRAQLHGAAHPSRRTTASSASSGTCSRSGAPAHLGHPDRASPRSVVAVIDTGIAYEDFGPYRKAPDWGNTVFVQGYDFVNADTHANDDESHGTHVASTIAEATNNGGGRRGPRLQLHPDARQGPGQPGFRLLLRRGRGNRLCRQLHRRGREGEGHQPEPGRTRSERGDAPGDRSGSRRRHRGRRRVGERERPRVASRPPFPTSSA